MARKQYTYHYIYKTTNLLNNKYYIGMHSTFNLDDGYIGSGTYLWRSIKKYGKENFKVKILEYLPDRVSLKTREKEIVNEDLLNDPLCMNLTIGGYGDWYHENSNAIKQSRKGKKGNLKMAYLRESNLEWKRMLYVNQSNGQITSYKNGRIPVTPNWTGLTHTQETKEKIGKANSLSQAGSKNSQFGKVWIHNIELKENKRINKEDLEEYLKENQGWLKGRKMKFSKNNKRYI